jgi:tetratricopeptide (TPR) repeat protein
MAMGRVYLLKAKGVLVFVLPLCLGVSVVNFLFTARGAQQTGEPPLQGPLAEGVNLIAKGQFPEAVQVFNRAKQDAPQDSRPYFYCGMALAQAGHMPDAASELLEAVHLAPDRLEYRVFQAHVFEQLKQNSAAENALAVFRDEHALQQLTPAWLQLLADVCYRLQETDMGLRALDLWSKSDPNNAAIDFARGQVYVLKAQPDMALRSFQQSLEKSTQNPQAYFELGKILYSENQLPSAKDALLSAVREDANNPEYASKLASVYLAMGDTDAAIECLKRMETAAPDLPMIYYILGRAYRKKGDSVRSGEYLEKFRQATAAERERTERALQISRPIGQAERQLDQGHTAEARALFEKALQVDPNRWEPHANLAEMDLNDGDLQGAYPHLEKLEQINPDSAIGNFLMARYWFQQKQYAQARVYAEKVKTSRPDNSELRAMLGDIYAQLGEKPKAMQEYEEAILLAPGRQDLRQRLQKLRDEESNPGRRSQP